MCKIAYHQLNSWGQPAGQEGPPLSVVSDELMESIGIGQIAELALHIVHKTIRLPLQFCLFNFLIFK
jgi:hypothetical protein